MLQIVTRDQLQPLKPVKVSRLEELVDRLIATTPPKGFGIYIVVFAAGRN